MRYQSRFFGTSFWHKTGIQVLWRESMVYWRQIRENNWLRENNWQKSRINLKTFTSRLKFNWSLFGSVSQSVSKAGPKRRLWYLPMKLPHELSPLPRVVLVKPTWGQYSLLCNHARTGAEGAGKNSVFRGFLTIFGSKLRFLENCIAKCTMHSFCEGARPTDEIYVTVSMDSYALALRGSA